MRFSGERNRDEECRGVGGCVQHVKTNGWWEQSGRIATTLFVGKGKDKIVMVQFLLQEKGKGMGKVWWGTHPCAEPGLVGSAATEAAHTSSSTVL